MMETITIETDENGIATLMLNRPKSTTPCRRR